MNKDSYLIFEGYKKKLTEGHSTEAEIEKLLNYLRQDYSEGRGLDNDTLGDVIHEIEDIIRSGSPTGGEDAEGLPDSIEANRKNQTPFDRVSDPMSKIEQKRKDKKNIGSVRTEDAEGLSISQADWGDSYQEVKSLIDQVLSYGIDKNVLSGVLKYAEEVGYTGEGVDNLLKLIQHFNQMGVQDS
jgi:hypothetical protein